MMSLSDSDGLSLLCMARQAVIEAVSRGQILAEIPSGGVFSEQRGAFVTLHAGRRLRGCIGVVEPKPLGDSVVRCAASAPLQDPRFPALRPNQLNNPQIAISLLYLLIPIF